MTYPVGYGSKEEYEQDYDLGSIDIEPHEVPDWLDLKGGCPVCAAPIVEHDTLRVVRASGEIFACLLSEKDGWEQLPKTDDDYGWT